jgi:hypothetical protein
MESKQYVDYKLRIAELYLEAGCKLEAILILRETNRQLSDIYNEASPPDSDGCDDLWGDSLPLAESRDVCGDPPAGLGGAFAHTSNRRAHGPGECLSKKQVDDLLANVTVEGAASDTTEVIVLDPKSEVAQTIVRNTAAAKMGGPYPTAEFLAAVTAHFGPDTLTFD